MILDCRELGMEMTIVKSASDTGGKSFEMEWVIAPHAGGTPVHIHPEAIETYTIKSGELEVFKNDKWVTAKAGETIVIQKGEAHTFRNSTAEPVRLYNTHQPAMQFETFFRGLHQFANSGLVKDGKMTLKSIIGISTLWTNYQSEIVPVKPPPIVMRIFGFVGRRMGIDFK